MCVLPGKSYYEKEKLETKTKIVSQFWRYLKLPTTGSHGEQRQVVGKIMLAVQK